MNNLTLDQATPETIRQRSRAGLYIPIIVFAVMSAVLGWGLTTDPKSIPSALLGKPVPDFTLPPVKGRTLGLSSKNLRGEVSLVNVFASWCTACLQEHPIFMQLMEERTVPIHGLNYKDPKDGAARWLDKHGDPYTRTGADISGRVGIEWGVYGVPETFVIGKDGHVKYKHIGPITQKIFQEKLLPLIGRLRKQ